MPKLSIFMGLNPCSMSNLAMAYLKIELEAGPLLDHFKITKILSVMKIRNGLPQPHSRMTRAISKPDSAEPWLGKA